MSAVEASLGQAESELPLPSPYWPEKFPRSLVLPETSLDYNLEVSANRYPDKPLIIYYDQPLGYRKAWQQVQSLAGYLREKAGVAAGDRVMLDMQNSPQFVIAYYAILRAGGVVVPVNPMNRTQELEHYFSDSGARTTVVGQEVYDQVKPLLGDKVDTAIVAAYGDYVGETDLDLPDVVAAPRQSIEDEGAVMWQAALEAGCEPPTERRDYEDLAVLGYTSGTTGEPKGCMHTHHSVIANTVGNSLWASGSPTANGVLLATLPFFHVTGMQNNMNTAIFVGATMVMMTRWERTTAARLIERYRVKSWVNIATMAIDFLSNPDIDQYDLSSLENIGGGGAAMPAAVAGRLHKLTGLEYQEGYGLTETMAASHVNPPGHMKRQCLGIPYFGVDSRIIDPETKKELPVGETGEIVINGPQVMRGYWNKPDKTAEAFIEIDGKQFLRTGDLGYVDKDGYYFFVDRLKRMINASGYNVWPAEVESQLYEHPAVQEACVIAAPDAYRGETVKAAIVLDPSVEAPTEEELIAWARERMAAYKCPRQVEFVDELPKTATGKVAWRVLQEQERERQHQS